MGYEFRGNTYRNLAELREWTGKRQEAALEPDLPIIDPHHHQWDDARGPYLVRELAEDVHAHRACTEHGEDFERDDGRV